MPARACRVRVARVLRGRLPIGTHRLRAAIGESECVADSHPVAGDVVGTRTVEVDVDPHRERGHQDGRTSHRPELPGANPSEGPDDHRRREAQDGRHRR